MSEPRCEPKYNCGVHYITFCSAGPISRYCTVLYCTRATSSSCRTLQLLSLPLRFRLEKLLAGECKYRNDIPGIPFYCPFLPRTFRLLPYAFFHPALFFAFVFIIYLCTLPFFLLVQSVGSSCGDIKT